MIKKVTALTVAGVLLLAGVSLFPVAAYAQTDPFAGACENGGGDSPACQANGGNDPITSENGAIASVVSILAAVAGIVSIVSLIWGGIKYITSNGDSSKIASAKQAVVAAVIGLVIAVLARPIVVFVLSKI